jgi:hypothetical protein
VFLSRLCKLKIALTILVPYALLAVGSGFLHDHCGGNEHRSVTPAFGCCTHWSGNARLSAFPSGSHREQGECPACSFARSGQSGSHIAFAIGHVATVSNLVIPECFPYRGGDTRLPLSRGPPLG